MGSDDRTVDDLEWRQAERPAVEGLTGAAARIPGRADLLKIAEGWLQLCARAVERGTLNDDWEQIKSTIVGGLLALGATPGVPVWCEHIRHEVDGRWAYHDADTDGGLYSRSVARWEMFCMICGTRRPT